MTTARDIANYISSRTNLLGEVQLQKLVYYSQAWSMAWDGKPLFDEPIEAWQMGPVVRSLRHITVDAEASVKLSEAQRATIDAVVEHYGALTGKQLIELTHQEAPWVEAWGGRPADGSGDDPISLDSMRRTYGRQAFAKQGPKRRPVLVVESDREAVLRSATQASTEWAHTLERLSR